VIGHATFGGAEIVTGKPNLGGTPARQHVRTWSSANLSRDPNDRTIRLTIDAACGFASVIWSDLETRWSGYLTLERNSKKIDRAFGGRHFPDKGTDLTQKPEAILAFFKMHEQVSEQLMLFGSISHAIWVTSPKCDYWRRLVELLES
jgi:hypothetical protein